MGKYIQSFNEHSKVNESVSKFKIGKKYRVDRPDSDEYIIFTPTSINEEDDSMNVRVLEPGIDDTIFNISTVSKLATLI